MKPLVSVIIPVYKVEQYLQKCIESVCGQTLEALEIILVDDGSPDNCGRICDEYATRDSRIRVIHQRNGGLSAARNTGIRIAQADIIGFVDSDDWIEPDMIELLYRNLCKENADISVCGIYWHNKGNVSEKGDKTYAVQSSKEAIESVYRLPGVKMNVWNKLYRKHLFHEICFPEGRINEDVYVTVRLLDAARFFSGSRRGWLCLTAWKGRWRIIGFCRRSIRNWPESRGSAGSMPILLCSLQC